MLSVFAFLSRAKIPDSRGSLTNSYQPEPYLVSHFGDLPLRSLSAFDSQVWLNGLAEKGYSEATFGQSFFQCSCDYSHGQKAEISG